MRRALKGMILNIIEYTKLTPDIRQDMLDVVVKTDKLEKTLKELYKTVGKAFASEQFKEFNKWKAEYDPSVWEDILEAYATIESGVKIKSIKGTQLEMLWSLLSEIQLEAVENGYGVEKTARYLRKELLKRGIEKQQWYARRIVHTETGASSNYAQIESARQLPFKVNKRWIAIPAKTTDRHYPGMNNHPEIDIDDLFNVDGELMSQPFDSRHGATAKNIVNCRCRIEFVRYGT